MSNAKLADAIQEFAKKKKSNTAYYEENWAERKERKEYLNDILAHTVENPGILSDR